MFNIFDTTKKSCIECFATRKEKNIVGFDPTNRGEFEQNGKKEYFCLEHFKPKFVSQLGKFLGKAICFEPEERFNSYSYINLQRAPKWSLEEDLVNDIQEILSTHVQNWKCKECGSLARFLLYNFDFETYYKKYFYKNDPFDLMDGNNYVFLCNKHFAYQIVNQIKTKDIKLDEINIPYDNAGIYLRGEF